MGSSPVVGSSSSRSVGFAATARAIATRRRWPPESSDGSRSTYLPQPDEAQHLLDSLPHLVVRRVRLFSEPVADVLSNGQGVEERSFLKQHADVRAQAQEVAFAHVVDPGSVDEDLSAVGPEQSERQFQHNRFSSAAGAQHDAHAVFRDDEADVAEHDVVVEGEGHVFEDDCRGAHRGRQVFCLVQAAGAARSARFLAAPLGDVRPLALEGVRPFRNGARLGIKTLGVARSKHDA